MSLFPFIDGEVEAELEESGEEDLPLYRDYAWDFENDTFDLKDGKFQILSGRRAVKVWIYKTLKTVQGRYKIYSDNYGSKIEKLIGNSFSQSLIRSQVKRYVREALLDNDYIEDIERIELDFNKETLSIELTVSTIYGEVVLDV